MQVVVRIRAIRFEVRRSPKTNASKRMRLSMFRLFSILNMTVGMVCLWTSAGLAQAPESPTKPKVMVIKEVAKLNVKTDAVGELNRGSVFTPTQENGQWLWYAQKKAWIRKSDVAPLDQAVDIFTKQIEANPQNEEAYLNRALALESAGQNKSALEDYNKVLEINPNLIEGLRLRAGLFLRFNVYIDAISDLTRLIDLEPKNVNHLLKRCDAWRGKGDIENAKADVNAAMRLDPRNAVIYNKRGVIRGNNDELEEALSDYSTAIQLDPKFALAYSNRGITYKRLGKNQEALADHTKAIELDPNEPYDYKYRADVLAALRKHEEAIADYTRALERRPTYSLALRSRGDCHRILQNYETAIKDYTRTIEIDPKDAIAFNNRGYTYKLAGQYDEALADYEEVLKLTPGDRVTIQNRGELYRTMGEFDKAIADYNLLLKDDPNNSGLYNTRGLSWHGKKELDKAIADFSKAIELNAKEPQMYVNRADVYVEKAEYQAALADYDKAIELDKGTPAYFDSRAWLRATCPDESVRNGIKAVLDANKCCELNGHRYYAYIDTLAVAYASTGEFDEAIKWEEKAIEMAPNEKTKELYRSRLALFRNKQPYLIKAPGDYDNAPQITDDTPKPAKPKMEKPVAPPAIPDTPSDSAPPAPSDEAVESDESYKDAKAFGAMIVVPKVFMAWSGMQYVPKDDIQKSFKNKFGVDAKDVNQITVLMFDSNRLPPVSLFGTKKDITADDIDGTLVPKLNRVEKSAGRFKYFENRGFGMFVDSKSGVIGYGKPRSIAHILTGNRIPEGVRSALSVDLDEVTAAIVYLSGDGMRKLIEKPPVGGFAPDAVPLVEIAKASKFVNAKLVFGGTAIELIINAEGKDEIAALYIKSELEKYKKFLNDRLKANSEKIIAQTAGLGIEDAIVKLADDLIYQMKPKKEKLTVSMALYAQANGLYGYAKILEKFSPALKVVFGGAVSQSPQEAPAAPDKPKMEKPDAPPAVPEDPTEDAPAVEESLVKEYDAEANKDVQAFGAIVFWPKVILESSVMKYLPKEAIVKSFKKKFGVDPEHINKVTILMFASKTLPPVTVFGLNKKYSYDDVDGTLVPKEQRVLKTVGPTKIFMNGNTGLFIDIGKIVLYGDHRSVEHMIGGNRIPTKLNQLLGIEPKFTEMEFFVRCDSLQELLDKAPEGTIPPQIAQLVEINKGLDGINGHFKFGGAAFELIANLSADDEETATVVKSQILELKEDLKNSLKANSEKIIASTAPFGVGDAVVKLADDLLYQVKPNQVGYNVSMSLYGQAEGLYGYGGPILEKLAPVIKHLFGEKGRGEEPIPVDEPAEAPEEAPSAPSKLDDE